VSCALDRLEHELPPHLCYHSLRHTRDDVALAVERLAEMEGIDGRPLQLLRTAAAYHDIGFVEQYADHEARSVHIATETLPHFGFGSEDIRAVTGMIWATKLPQQPRTVLEELLADADLDSLGRDDFFATSLSLRAEMAARGQLIDHARWFARQISFLRSHRYWTPSARSLRDPQKQRNVEVLSVRLAVLQPQPNYW